MDRVILKRFLMDSARYFELDLEKGKALGQALPLSTSAPAGNPGWVMHRTAAQWRGVGNSLRA